MLELSRLSYTYPGADRPAVRDLTLTLEPGEITALMGPNGSGKSTVARLICGLLQPDTGGICIDGSCPDQGPGTMNNLIGFVRQDPRDQIIAAVVDQDVAFGPENLNLKQAEIQKRVAASLARVGLAGLEKRSPDTLSVGQQQRLAIAGIVAMQPSYLVFDEAAAMLDPASREEFYRLCRSLAEDGYGVLTITHLPDEAFCCDRVILLDRGRLAVDAAPGQIAAETHPLSIPYLELLRRELASREIFIDAVADPKLLIDSLPRLISGARS